jgi:hypothetical protein
MAVAVLASLSCSGDSLNDGHPTSISGTVVWTSPVAGARVEAYQITVGGELYNGEIIASTTTGEDGSYTLPLGIQGNIIELRAFGGRTTDVYTGTSLTLDDAVELRAYHQHIQLDQLVTGATVSPITTLQADLADARRHAKRPDSLDGDSSIDRARALLGSHLLDIAAETTTPADVSSPTAVPAPSPTVEYRYGLVLAGMSVYSAQIAQASGLTVQDFNITHLYHGLAADLASDPDIVFDGHTSTGFAHVGACPLKLDCPAGTDFDAKPDCRTACDLFANSPRAYLARGILAWLGDVKNKSGISPEDLRSRLEQMAGNTEPNLFGPTPPEALLTDGPAITFDSPSGTVMGLVDIKVTAASPVGVQTLIVGWDTTTPGPALVDANPDPAVFEVHGFDTTQLGDAEWILTASATDSLGHPTNGAKHSFVIDNIGFGTVSGVAIKGPIDGATVRAFRFTGGVRGALLGTGTTNAAGVFSNVTLAQGYSGPVEVAVGRSGVYTEESSPVQVTVDVDNELRTIIPAYADGQAIGQVVVTPITSFAAALLDWKVAQAGASANIPTLWQAAVATMQGQFEIPDIEHLTPIAPASIVTLSGGARYSLALVGLSQRALQVSSNRPAGSGDAGSFPSVMNSLVATAKLEADLRSDGCWNGKAGATELFYGGTTKLSANDTRIGLASAIVGYVSGPENLTPFANAGDLLGLLDTLSLGGTTTGTGGCPGGGIYPDDGKGYDQQKPTVGFIGATPADLSLVRGTIMVQASATDDISTPSVTWTMPSGPSGLVDTDGDPTNANAQATINTASPPYSDGPLVVEATATDKSSNSQTAVRHFTIDNTAPTVTLGLAGAFVQVGSTYWTALPKPNLTGTVSDAHAVTVAVKVNGAACADAMVSGGTWTLTTATWGCAALVQGPNAIAVTATDAAGNVRTATGSLSYDATPPVLTFDTGATEVVPDERRDSIVFTASTHAPTHAHVTTNAVNLGTASCASPPDVFMYAYLLDEAQPPYGIDSAPSKIRWKFSASDDPGTGLGVGIDASGTQYRLLAPGGAVLHDWLSVAEAAAGSLTFDVPVYRKASAWAATPEIGTTLGVFQIEFRATDLLGRQTTATRCWNHHPLAAPLDVLGGNAATTVGSSKVALTSLFLSTSAIDSLVLNDGAPGAGLVEFAVYNGTAETVYVTFDMTGGVPATLPTYSKTSVAKYFEVGYTPGVYQCPGIASPECGNISTLPANPYTALSGSGMLSAPSYSLRAFDTTAGGATEVQPCTGSACVNTALSKTFTVPARGAAAPVAFSIVNVIKTIPELRPDPAPPYNRPSLDYYTPPSGTTTTSVIITGKKAGSTVFRCDKPTYTQEIPAGSGNIVKFCPRLGAYTPYLALQQASLTFPGAATFKTAVTGSPSSDTAPVVPFVSSVSSGNALGWNTTQSPPLPSPIP